MITGSAILAKDERTFNRFFNTSVFGLAPVGTVGTAAKTVFRSPGVNNWDASIAKSFRIVERVQLRVRIEAYNAFNHTVLNTRRIIGRTCCFGNRTWPTNGPTTGAGPRSATC